jgi:4-hydroxybenzoyl-CoA thioesterase
MRACAALLRALGDYAGYWPAQASDAPRHGFPTAVTAFTFRRQFTIEWGHCDPAGIVFNARFFEFFDRNAWLMFEAALGVPAHELSKVFDIVGIPLVGSQAKFLAPAKFGDVADIESRVVEMRRSSFDLEHRIFVAGTLAVEGLEKRVWAGRHPEDPLRMKARAIPDEVAAKLKGA